LATLVDPSSGTPMTDVLTMPAALSALSPDGRARFGRVAPLLASALAARGREALAARVRGAWLALGGPACVEEAIDLDASEQFFALLAKHEQAGEVSDWAQFIDALDQLRAAPADSQNASPPLTVMTLHRAKGLEFDTVILPGLGRSTQRDENELLRWRRRPAGGVLLAPARSRGGDKDPTYEYLSRLEKDEEDAELGRLLYVGCTRARECLHLIAAHETDDSDGTTRWKKPSSGSALAKLWRAMREVPPAQRRDASATAPPPPKLRRVPALWATPQAPQPSIPFAARTRSRAQPTMPPFDWAHETARCLGIVGHRIFREVAEQGIDAWPEQRISGLQPRLAAEFAHLGVEASDTEAASTRIQTALRRALADARGQWLLDPRHRESRSEQALSSMIDGEVTHVVLDRSFIDADGTRWVVDFKFSQHEGRDLEGFLDSERERYREQLERYAEVIRKGDSRPTRLGLYFPLLGGWREWDAPA
jgi:ATP-dependent exoDNAse (exonuclease V) beta subunit